MTTHTASPQSVHGSDATVSGIQHVGHVVRDIATGIALYRRMGFVVPPPSFPALTRPGEPLRAFGAGTRTSASGVPSSNWSQSSMIAEGWVQMPPWSPYRRRPRPWIG